MIGQTLREAREAKGCTLEEAEHITRIRAKYLAAMEADDFAALPSRAQIVGFLRNYAHFLGLDTEQVLTRYQSGAGQKARASVARAAPPTEASPPAEAPAPPGRPQAKLLPPRPAPGSNVGRAPQVRSGRPRWLSPDVIVAGTITLGLGLLVLWGGARLANALQTTPAPSLAPTLEAQALGPASTATLAPIDPTATLLLPTAQATYVGVNLVVRAEQRVWLRVIVDGGQAFSGLLAPGETREFVGQSVIELVTGNGQGTRVIWNGQDQGTLGQLGEVVVRLWTLDGMVVPTPTVTPTPSRTLPPTRTPVPSPTPRP